MKYQGAGNKYSSGIDLEDASRDRYIQSKKCKKGGKRAQVFWVRINESFLSQRGGSETFAYQYAGSLRGRKNEGARFNGIG